MEDAAWEACATAGDVVWGAGRAEGPLTHLTWHVALADSALLSGADAALHFLRESAVYTMLAAVQQRLGFAEPKTQSPARKKVIIIDKISSWKKYRLGFTKWRWNWNKSVLRWHEKLFTNMLKLFSEDLRSALFSLW